MVLCFFQFAGYNNIRNNSNNIRIGGFLMDATMQYDRATVMADMKENQKHKFLDQFSKGSV